VALSFLTRLFLAPVLIWQGRQVKKKTPRLPEAAGPRSGHQVGGPRKIRLLILGDSAAAGTGVGRQEDCIAFQLPKALSSRYMVDWSLAAQSGLTTVQMADRLEQMAGHSTDLAITSLGVNDVKAGMSISAFLDHQKRLIFLLRQRFQVSQIIVTAVPPMEKFPALPWPLNRYLGARAAAMNQALARWVEQEGDITFLTLELPFEDRLMAGDGFHPGPELHRIWAEQAAALVKGGLGKPTYFP